MGDNWQDKVGRWMAIEQGGTDEAADAAFAELFHAVPVLAPSPRFAGRVMEAIGRTEHHQPAFIDSWWARSALATAMLLVGIVASGVAPAALAAGLVVSVTRGVGTGTSILSLLSSLLDRALAVWAFLAEVARAAVLALQAPSALLFIVANLVVVAGGIAALRRLLGQQEDVA